LDEDIENCDRRGLSCIFIHDAKKKTRGMKERKKEKQENKGRRERSEKPNRALLESHKTLHFLCKYLISMTARCLKIALDNKLHKPIERKQKCKQETYERKNI